MKVLTLLLTLNLWCTATAADIAFNLDSLFVESVGGPAAVDSLRHLRSYRAEGSMNLNGTTGRFVECFVPPDRFYTRMEFGPYSMVQAYDGRTAWQQDMNGQVSKLEGYERDELLKGLYFNTHSYLFPDRFEGSYKYEGDTVQDGVTYHVVAFRPLNLDTVIVYFDAQTAQMAQSVTYMDELPVRTFYRKTHRWGGIRWPTEMEVVAEGAPVSMEAQYDTVIVNEPVDLSIFRVPLADNTNRDFPAGVDSVTIPLYYHAGHLKVPMVLNGTTRVWMILDTGASANILNKPVIDRLSLPVVGNMAAKGITDYEKVELVDVDSISVSSLAVHDLVAGSMDLSTLSPPGPDGDPFGGVLGYDFLSRYPFMVDYEDSTLTIYNPANFTPPEGGAEVDFFLTMKVPTVKGLLNGLPGDYIVDLGNAFGLVVHRRFAQTHHLDKLLDHVDSIPQSIGGVGGAITGRMATATSFQIGDVLLQSVRVLMPDSAAGLAGSEELAGNIGNLVLENFKILLDYSDSRLIFYGSGKDKEAPEPVHDLE